MEYDIKPSFSKIVCSILTLEFLYPPIYFKKEMTSVVIVDDEEDLVSALSSYFEEMSITVLAQGSNGGDAVKLYEKYRPDVLLLDIDMPKYDGRYSIEKIKKIESKAKIMVITGHFPFDTKLISNPAGVFVHYKPLDLPKLVKQVEAMKKLGDRVFALQK